MTAAAVSLDTNGLRSTLSQAEEPAEYHHLHDLSSRDENSVHDFNPIRILGRGAMGTVLLAVHRKFQKPFALKVMSKTGMLRRRSLCRAQTEMDVLARLDHPFLPTLHSYFESAGYNFLVLNYCSGGDLYVLRHKQPERKFSEAAARFYGAELILALEHLHELGFVYRDLKPENVLLSDSGHVILTDFDLCLRLPPQMRIPMELALDAEQVTKQRLDKRSFLFSCFRDNVTDSDEAVMGYCNPVSCGQSRKRQNCGTTGGLPWLDGFTQANFDRYDGKNTIETLKYFIGTEEYVAPEVLLGEDHHFAVDWWAFGVLLCELVYGKTPFKGLNRKRTFFNILYREPDIPGSRNPLQDLIRKLLVKDPEQRLGHNGAIELKDHAFFRGVQWDNLQHVARPPIVPGSTYLEELLLGSKGDQQVGTDLETYMATVGKPGRHRTSASSDDESDQSSDEEDVDSDCESFRADRGSRLVTTIASRN